MEEKTKIKPVQSIIAGLVVNLVLLLVLVPLGTSLFNSIVSLKYSFYFYSLPMAAIIAAVFGFGGKRSVKPFHEGVLHVFGDPIEDYVLDNGVHWIFPGIFSVRPVDMREDEITIERVKTFTKPPDPAQLWFNVTVPYNVEDSYRFLKVSEGKLPILLKQLAEKVLQCVSRQRGFDDALGMQGEFNEVFNKICSRESTPQEVKTKYGITEDDDGATQRWGLKIAGAFLSDPELDKKVSDDLELGRREKLQRRAIRTEAANNIEVMNSYQGEPLTYEEEEIDPATRRTTISTKTVQIKNPLSPEAAMLLHQTQTGKVVKTVDEKRIVIPEGSHGVGILEAILTAWLGRQK